jgi:hypothetical protein
LWKESAVVPVFKKGSSAMASNYCIDPYVTTSPKVSNLLFMTTYICLKYRLNPSQHGFHKHKSSLPSYGSTAKSGLGLLFLRFLNHTHLDTW